MWPNKVKWEQLKFGVEIEFVGGDPMKLNVLPGWINALDEKQIDEAGEPSGSEIKPLPMLWQERRQIKIMLDRLCQQRAMANWSCGLHVHVSLEPWGEQIIPPMLDAALQHQESLMALFQTSDHRKLYCSPVLDEMRKAYKHRPSGKALRFPGRPQAQRCGINLADYHDIGTVEFRFANGSLNYNEIVQSIELYMRFVAAIGEGKRLNAVDAGSLARELGMPENGYPPASQAPLWYKERIWLDEQLAAVLQPYVEKHAAGKEILSIVPVSDGILMTVEDEEDKQEQYKLRFPEKGWRLLKPEFQ